ncbi:MAG TPA: UPF0280 family protein [Syntrophorhabdaceae bacterium]|nr:UPF0280 family protein [Syntrophorhabdaceae bacterium]HQM80706.1 UPF0280 family protein [Syntrophorhabdaceae bacterium]
MGEIEGMYEERFYRGIAKPKDLNCYEVKCKETDLFCCTRGNFHGFIMGKVLFYRNQLEEYIKSRPEFRDSLVPLADDPFAPRIVREMMEASRIIGIGPMATVAGAIAEFVGRDIAPFSEEYIIENGGDIFLRTDAERIIEVYAKDSPFSERIGVSVKPDNEPWGICTSSGTVGHSLSFGKADAVCIIGRSSLFTDGLATCIGNIVKKKDDIPMAIEKGKAFSGVKGVLIIFGESLGVWGDLEIVEI